MDHPRNAQNHHYDVIIIGAGASGLYCALTAGRRDRRVLVLDHANKAGKKILMSGGGRCNFTNYFVEPEHFIGSNLHFCKSALSRYPSWEFIAMVDEHKIPYHEREHGQLFCDESAQDILTMLLDECAAVGVQVKLNTHIESVQLSENNKNTRFQLITSKQLSKKEKQERKESNHQTKLPQTGYSCESLVVATGGLSIPTLGASGFGYELAQQFGHTLIATDPSLVPFTFTDKTGERIRTLLESAYPSLSVMNVSHLNCRCSLPIAVYLVLRCCNYQTIGILVKLSPSTCFPIVT